MSPGQEFDRNSMMLTQTSQLDYEELCRIDVLGLVDSSEHDQQAVYSEFKEQLVRSKEGWYETGLPWCGNHPPLLSNKQGSLHRLNNLNKKLKRQGITAEYNQIIQDQKEEGIIEECSSEPAKREFYIPHKPVIRQDATTTKLRVVYDASARARPDAPSLNECLYPGPALQNKLWDVLVLQRFYPVAIFGDIQKAFLQIRIKEQERDALRFHWRINEHSDFEAYRFTRALFGLTCSPFLLGGAIEQHLTSWENKMPEIVQTLRKNLYVDDLLSGGLTVDQARERKISAVEIFSDAKLLLHKWNSNVPELEDSCNIQELDSELSFAKQQAGTQSSESKVLGLPWDKGNDTVAVTFPESETPSTKRGVLKKLAKVYDPLGLVTPLTLQGKLIHRDICERKQPWDTKLSEPLLEKVKKWERILPTEMTVPRPVVDYREPVQAVELHAFGDASTRGVGAAVYVVVRQQTGTTQRLVTAKGRLAKQGLTVPRLELISAHMATNLVINVRNAMVGLPSPTVFAWLDSTVAPHWICGNGQYKQFVANRVNKIHQHPDIQWRYIPTYENPADLAIRGGSVSESNLWWNGPEWLTNQEEWPPNPVTSASPATESEAKTIREVLTVATATSTRVVLDEVLEKRDFRRALRVMTWATRFINNCETTSRLSGPLATAEVERVKRNWIKQVQQQAMKTPDYPQLQSSLNLQLNEDGILECRGRIQGKYPVFLPEDAMFTQKLVRQVHCKTLHRGVGLTMAAVRVDYWVPRLRRLVKKMRKECWGCKRFQALALAAPPPGPLPTNRTEGTTAFEVVGVDFAGPIRYRKGGSREGKAYLVLFSCSLTRGVYLEVVPSLESGRFLPCLKRLIARRGRPKVLYSDNGGTFVKAAKWVRTVRHDEKIQGLLEQHHIQWIFNLSRAPWWGGQLERLIGVMKQAFYKTIGAASLTWDELTEVVLDVEVKLNRRPLSYVEDDIQLPILTPAAFLFQRSNLLPEQQSWREEDINLRRHEKYLKSCKDQLWRRWTKEYLTALRERHNLTHKQKKFEVKTGDVVLIKSDSKNRNKWPMGVVSQVYPGRDGVVRAVEVDTAAGKLERPIQHLYPMELSCDRSKPPQLNPLAEAYRPRRQAAVVAAENIRTIARCEQVSC